jgi:acetoin utilization protein AcuB
MNVSDIMTPKPAIVHLRDTLHDALEMMDRIGCHHLPVMSNDHHLIGIVSDRDCRSALNSPYIMRETWQDDELTHRLQVHTIMTPAPIVIAPEARAEEAARMMLQNHISCLPVMRDETLVGIITTADLLKAFILQTQRNSFRDIPG